MIKFIDLQQQYESIKNEINEAIFSVIQDSAFIGGKYVRKFEEEFAEYHKAKYCVAVGNGTDALEIALEALSLPGGSEVVVPANSFIASGEAVSRSGHKVRFCDCDPHNYTLSIEDVRSKVNGRTGAIMPVHLYGHPCDMDEIISLAKERDIKVIEDCAQAHGAEYKGKKIGAMGDIGCFSFYPGKNLGAYGDAGCIITNNEALAKKCRMIANHGRIEKYNHEFEGRNSRMDGLQAAILSVKLNHLDQWIDARRSVAVSYKKALSELKGIVLPAEEEWAKHVYHLFVIRTDRRDELKNYLQKHKIETGIHYPISLPKLKAYDYLQSGEDKLDANALDALLLSLPIGEHLSCESVSFINNQIVEFFNK